VSDPLAAAVEALFRAPLNEFVAERKRLAGELKASGDKAAATKLSQVARPSVLAWTVNQLWWRQRPAFEALLHAAASVKAGDREASKQHREALAELRQHATALLEEAGNAASEGTLRRIATTLSALAAAGGFAPDPPGALVADRDPPGFETFVASSSSPAPRAQQSAPSAVDAAAAAKAEKAAEAARRRAEEAERERRRAERERLSDALREAQQLRGAQQREVTRLKQELDSAEQSLKQTQTLLADLEAQLASL
jgi:DNA repair exonuclease SbcCD ATPase subunit